ncbi:peroxisome assembly protein 12-like [Daktulosphaira vitifoliae]|uniref:peroxisome assembly protein 12-like n=1 Tax=Daktulosphaira vitifoliae TaxID=58002 RepID=UPI0021A9E577|nr:peroxisome assembly protein 12-like [Daktulosphaira vitifoliae]
MAEKAAHHTTTVVTCPSIFEVIAQESLSATIYPALKKLVDYINLKNSNKCIWLVQYFDEVYLIFNSLCQLYYLKTYGGTFSENFYDLTRVRQPSNLRSAQKQLLFNLALTVCVPYLRIKLETYITNSKTKHNTQLLDV